MAPYYMVCYCGVVGYAFNRERIRLKYGIGGDCCTDCLIWWCCPCCAGVQEFREMNLRELEKKDTPSTKLTVYVNGGQPASAYPQPPNYPVINNPAPQANIIEYSSSSNSSSSDSD
jgi:hypothetical protein